MVFAWLKPKTTPIAVDIGTESIKMLQLEPQNDQPRIVAVANIEFPEELRGKDRQRDEFAAEAIRQAIYETPFKGKQVVTCLPAAMMTVQHLRVPRMTDEELKRALPFEVAGKLPFDAARAVLRHVIAGEVYQEQESKTEVILMAAARESVDRHMAILERARLDVVGIHVEPSALIECFAYLFRRKGDENIATMYVDMGAGSTHVVIAHGKHMVFAKHVQVGGDALNKRAAEALQCTPAAARQTRIHLAGQHVPARIPAGVVALSDPARGHPLGNHPDRAAAAPDPATLDKVAAALVEPVETLIAELEMCVRYYESVFPGKPIDRVIFVGGESRHVAVCQKVAQRLGLPATLGDPLARLAKDDKTRCGIDLRMPQPGWAIAVGLGLGIKNLSE